ncbi:hypothetical protein CVT26_014074 [Gymnopilus dilepis]|uniref:Uncharacterized protein n=1 Tax=Gymnopilus dilepis TaxID=231916 RepID=A0A409VXA5_9AGAR|nr:hypothetical protein CVT26_014074 [Gymnopilus dilepis]
MKKRQGDAKDKAQQSARRKRIRSTRDRSPNFRPFPPDPEASELVLGSSGPSYDASNNTLVPAPPASWALNPSDGISIAGSSSSTGVPSTSGFMYYVPEAAQTVPKPPPRKKKMLSKRLKMLTSVQGALDAEGSRSTDPTPEQSTPIIGTVNQHVQGSRIHSTPPHEELSVPQDLSFDDYGLSEFDNFGLGSPSALADLEELQAFHLGQSLGGVTSFDTEEYSQHPLNAFTNDWNGETSFTEYHQELAPPSTMPAAYPSSAQLAPTFFQPHEPSAAYRSGGGQGYEISQTVQHRYILPASHNSNAPLAPDNGPQMFQTPHPSSSAGLRERETSDRTGTEYTHVRHPSQNMRRTTSTSVEPSTNADSSRQSATSGTNQRSINSSPESSLSNWNAYRS